MIEFIPLRPEHLLQIDLPSSVEHARPANGLALCVPDLAWAGRADGGIVGAAGILPQWPGRAIAWTMFTPIKLREWPAITAKVGEVLQFAAELGYRRIEAHVDANQAQACRWIRRLGFALETPSPMRSWAPDGRAFFLYAKVTP